MDWRFSMEISAVFVGIVFPMVFLIGQTWGRREQASVCLSTIRANGVQMTLLKLGSGGEAARENAREVVCTMTELCDQIAAYLPQDSFGSLVRLSSIYGLLAKLNNMCDHNVVRFVGVEFEKLRQLRNYRTPWKLNYFVSLFCHLAPVVFAPMFATVGCMDKNPERPVTWGDGHSCGTRAYGSIGAYISMVFFTTLLAALLAVAQALEDPFALDGFDDLLCQFAIEGRALMHIIEDQGEHTSIAL